ncbi:MAG: peptidase S14 [Rhizobiales bacterium 63-7]|nr:MAG: peptidase S14 [Rhizobiales bacterium 63-7]
MAAILQDGVLRLTGSVGDYYFDDGFTSSDVVLALAQVDDAADLPVHLNSPGGIASEGAAIHALLTARTGRTDIIVEGIAASAASLIAMAGATVTMTAGSVMMIHDPAGMTWGNSADHSKTIEALEALATAYARVYAAKSGKSAEECRQIMKDERWFSPQEAVDAGFADETTEQASPMAAAFDYRLFAKAPKRLTALAKKHNWSMSTANPAPAAPPLPKETSMSDKERADQLAAENTKLKADLAAAQASAETAVSEDRERRTAIMSLDEAKGREQLAEHFFSTGLTADAAKTALALAPKGAEEPEFVEDFQPRRMQASGLNREQKAGSGGKQPPQMRVNLAADMKRRHGGK